MLQVNEAVYWGCVLNQPVSCKLSVWLCQRFDIRRLTRALHMQFSSYSQVVSFKAFLSSLPFYYLEPGSLNPMFTRVQRSLSLYRSKQCNLNHDPPIIHLLWCSGVYLASSVYKVRFKNVVAAAFLKKRKFSVRFIPSRGQVVLGRSSSSANWQEFGMG